MDAIENADLDVEQQDKLGAEFAKEIHLLTGVDVGLRFEVCSSALERFFNKSYSM